VLSTEDGQKTARTAEGTVTEAGNVMQQLADGLTSSVEAAQRILAAAQQQSQGMRQISDAMRAIDQAARQTVDGTHHVERAARDLTRLSGSLQQAVSQYRI
jgi:methyl-accepting chemotaxis protein